MLIVLALSLSIAYAFMLTTEPLSNINIFLISKAFSDFYLLFWLTVLLCSPDYLHRIVKWVEMTWYLHFETIYMSSYIRWCDVIFTRDKLVVIVCLIWKKSWFIHYRSVVYTCVMTCKLSNIIHNENSRDRHRKKTKIRKLEVISSWLYSHKLFIQSNTIPASSPKSTRTNLVFT